MKNLSGNNDPVCGGIVKLIKKISNLADDTSAESKGGPRIFLPIDVKALKFGLRHKFSKKNYIIQL